MSYGQGILGCSDDQLRQIILLKLRGAVTLNIRGVENDDEDFVMDTVTGVMQLVPDENNISNDKIIREVRSVAYSKKRDKALKSYWYLCKLINA